jgi:lambda family phage portal protein
MARIVKSSLSPQAPEKPLEKRSVGGALEGAEANSRDLFSWQPTIMSPDQQINLSKDLADARGRDSVQNDGYAMGALNTYRDNVVGSQYRLNAQPDYTTLGADAAWADEFQQIVEARFNLLSDSPECWFDAARRNTLTDIIRLAVASHFMTGESLATVEWIRQTGRPFSTAIQMVAPIRLSNPDGLPDSENLSRGVQRDGNGAAVGYHFRVTHPTEIFDARLFQWKYVPARKPWGRVQVIHIAEQLQPGQTRGVADMVSVLKNMRMTKRFQEVTLQNAVVNASYAAAIESELPKDVIFSSMGAGQQGFTEMLGQYMTAMSAYANASENIAVDGVKMPHLFPGTKLSLKPMGTPGGVGSQFEESLLRHTAAALGLSYEQLSRDYSKTNYSSARASMAETWKYMQGKKKFVADRKATVIYRLWMEEEINAGNIPLPRGMTNAIFYDPVLREALLNCTWIGASRGQIDEMKETQSAILRINSGLSTYEAECGRLGEDYRRIFAQRAREDKMLKALGLEFSSGAEKPGANDRQQLLKEKKQTDEKDDDL